MSASDFVGYCSNPSNAKPCHDEVLDIDTGDMLKAIHIGNGSAPAAQPKVCTLGGGAQMNTAQSDAAVQSVLNWLSQHQEVGAMTAPDAIRAAIAALWPC